MSEMLYMLCVSACTSSVLWVCLQWPQVKILQRPSQGQASKPISPQTAPLRIINRPVDPAVTPPAALERVPSVNLALSVFTSTHDFGSYTLAVLYMQCLLQ